MSLKIVSYSILNHNFEENQLNTLFAGLNRKKYSKTNMKIEKLSRIIYMAVVNISVPCVLLPKFISSYYLYFLGARGNDAFSLNFQMK